MPSSTTNMGLYKKNPSTDGNDTFDINTMLNDNWDRIDSQVGGQLGNSAPMAVNLVNGLQVVSAPKGAPLENLRITGRTLVNLLGRDGGCEDVSKWTDANSTHVLDLSNKTTGNSGIKGIIASGSAALVHRQFTSIKTGKYYIAMMDVKNGNATEVHFDYNSTSSALVTDTTKFTTVYIKLNPSVDYTGNFHFIANGVVGQYGYFDSARLYEISQAEYNALTTMTSTQIAAKYPYVDDVKHINAPYVIKYGENLLPPFVEWTANGAPTNLAISDPYSISFGGTSSAGTFTCVVPVVQGQTYTISMTKDTTNARLVVYKGNASSYTAAVATAANTATFTVDGTYTGNSVMVQIDNGSVAGPYTFTNPRMNIGAVDKGFKPRNDDMLAFPNVQLASSVDGTVYDTLFKREGKYFVEKRFKDVVLDGTIQWKFDPVSTKTGIKSIYMDDVAPLQSLLQKFGNSILSKYDGKILAQVTATAPSLLSDTYLYDVHFVLGIPNADSGWGDSFTPSTSEIQAYFYGWKMYDGVNGANLYTTGTKSWCYRIAGGGYTGGTNILPTSFVPANGYWSPYKLTYQLATPTFEEIQVDAGMSLHEGLNQIEVGQGFVVREKVTPLSIGGNFLINHSSAPSTSWLKNKTNRILKVFKNGIDNTKAVIATNNAGAVGGGAFSYITIADFDPSATYEVSYIALDQYLLSAPVQAVNGEVASNLKTVVDMLSMNQADQDARISANEILTRQIYNVPQKTSANMTLYVDGTNGADNNDGSAGKPFKTIQKAVNSAPQFLNQLVVINVAPGTYAEDVNVINFSGQLTLIATNSGQGSTNVNSISFGICKGRFEANGFTATTTGRSAFYAFYTDAAIFSNCYVVTASGSSGFEFTTSIGRISGGTVSNRLNGIYANFYSHVQLNNISGTGNSTGVASDQGAIVTIYGNPLPTGTIPLYVNQGGTIIPVSGVINPWGDNTFLNRSYFRAVPSVVTPVNSGVWTKVAFGTEGADNIGEYDPVLSRFTAKANGIYNLNAALMITAALNCYTQISFYANGVAGYARVLNQTGAESTLGITENMYMNAGDYIEVYVFQNSGVTRNTDASGAVSRFIGTRIA
ncbi:DUF1565 domain-containing protein [Paenibacillus alba]|uniref:DUF1565 domain-containing protein n=1 Tax=Paenibacillus alba TaxID=1197127 RepID=A0ABU6G5K7_9BACL|nr:DUF1565 domain-containing protein [Paenibacillus alba]MEC0228069.1 DUF1565 domain-containing protein [Paenibacillus alba]